MFIVQKAQSLWGKLMSGQEYDKELFKNYYKEMCKDITKQKERIGGDWAIAHVVFSREIRDMMRLHPNFNFYHISIKFLF